MSEAKPAVAAVVPLRRADHIPAMLRSLADDIEAGTVIAEEVACVLRTGTNSVKLYGWGDYRGTIATIGLLEAGKMAVPVDDG